MRIFSFFRGVWSRLIGCLFRRGRVMQWHGWDDRDVPLINRLNGYGRVGHPLTYQVTFPPLGPPPLPGPPPPGYVPPTPPPPLPKTYEFQNLPPGLIGDPATGVVSGMPTKAGMFGVMVRATDAMAIQSCGVLFVIT